MLQSVQVIVELNVLCAVMKMMHWNLKVQQTDTVTNASIYTSNFWIEFVLCVVMKMMHWNLKVQQTDTVTNASIYTSNYWIECVVCCDENNALKFKSTTYWYRCKCFNLYKELLNWMCCVLWWNWCVELPEKIKES